MERYSPPNPPIHEREREFHWEIRRPFSEALLDGGTVFEDEILQAQIEERRTKLKTIVPVLDLLPQGDIAAVLEHSGLSAREVAAFYDSLSDILNDPDNARLVLYLPFGLLRPAIKDEDVLRHYETFEKTYMDRWWQLLSYRDHTADFTDGDLPDDRSVVPELVVKAAHLLPALLEKGIVTANTVASLRMQAEGDEILLRSIDEALNPKRHTALPHDENIDVITLYEQRLQTTFESEKDMTDNRRAWLMRTIRDAAIHDVGTQAANDEYKITALLHGTPLERMAGIVAYEQHVLAGAFPYLRPLETALQDDADVHDQAVLSLQLLCRAGIIGQAYLESLGISLPSQTGELSRNVITPEITERTRSAVEKIANHPELGRYVYSLVMVGGSTLKGYATETSDVDLAVFIKPNTPRDTLPELRQRLTEACGDHAMEFWLEAKPDGTLAVRSFATYDYNEADRYWPHTLFQSAWMGDQDTIDDLQRRLLPNYFTDDATERYLYLRRIEQDILQYRLLHKGYRRTHATEANDIFMDPGYRLLATRLYIEKVFLPKSSQIK